MHRVATGLSAFLFICLMCFFYANVWLNGVYLWSVTSIAYWAVVMPLFTAYLSYGG